MIGAGVRSGRWRQAGSSGAPTTTSGTAPPRCCRPGGGHRPGHRRLPAAPPPRRVPSLPQARRQGVPAPAVACRARQLHHPQPRQGPGLAGQPPADPPALHVDLCLVAEPGRGVRFDHRGPGQALRRGDVASVGELVAAIRRFCDGWNQRCQPFTWTKDADQIFAKFKRPTAM